MSRATFPVLSVLSLLLLFLVLTAAPHRVAASASTVERISVGNGPMQHNGSLNVDSTMVDRGALSADGRYLAFTSDATNLVTDPAAGSAYILDRSTGLNASLSPDERLGPSSMPALSRDGRYAVFVSQARRTPGGFSFQQNVFLRDRQTGVNERISLSSAGDTTNGNCARPSVSADGRYVAFESEGSNLTAGDSNAAADVFVRDRATGITISASVPGAGGASSGASGSPTLSADGRYVVFRSAAPLVAGDVNGVDDVFLRDLATGTTERVSVTNGGAEGNGAATGIPVISDDGRYVCFSSLATNLVAGDTNGNEDVFVRDRTTGTTERVSLSVSGTQSDHRSYRPDMSADGRYVAFESTALGAATFLPNGWTAIHIRDRLLGTTSVASISDAGDEGNKFDQHPALSADGRYVAFASDSTNLTSGDLLRPITLYVRDRQAGTTSLALLAHDDVLQPDRYSYLPQLSGDGRYVVFTSYATNLVAGDTNGREDVFVRDRTAKTTERVNVSASGAQSSFSGSNPSLSADGRYVCFTSLSALVPEDTNQFYDLFIRDRTAGTTTRVSLTNGGAQANGDAGTGVLSADGRYVAFDSQATNLVPGDTNGRFDVFVRDLSSGTTERVSMGTGGVQGNGDSVYPWISADGRYVTFVSLAANLSTGDGNGQWDVFIHDRQSGTTERVSVTSGGSSISGAELAPAPASSDGRFVVFASTASNVVSGDTNGLADIFLRDRSTGTTERVSLGNGNAQADAHSLRPVISADGRFVVFDFAGALPAGGSINSAVAVRDRLAGTTELVSLTPGGQPRSAVTAAITPDARKIAFVTYANDLLAPATPDTNGANDVYLAEYVPVSGAPIAQNQSVTTQEDTAVTLTLAAGDPEGDPLTYTLLSPPQHGTLTGSAAGRTYTPDANYFGSDSFTYRVSDGTSQSNVATVSLTITPVNDVPLTQGDDYSVLEDATLTVPVGTGVLSNDSDVEGTALTAVAAGAPSHGALTLNANGSFTYTPAANYFGPDSFTYRASDGAAQSPPTTVTLTVLAVDDPTVALDQAVTTAEDTAKSLQLTVLEVDGDPLTYTILSPPAHGTLSGSRESRTYTPAANYSGPDSFTFRVNDGHSDSNTGTISIDVTPVNDAPTALPETYHVDEDAVLTVSAAEGVLKNDTDADGDPLSAAVAQQPAHGSLSLAADGSFTYTPAANYSGSDSFTYRAGDGTSTSTATTVTLLVDPVEDAPVAQGATVTTDEDTAKAITLAATDADGDPLTYAVASSPAHGALSGTAPNLTYTPAADYYGPDSFTFKASDGMLESSPATVNISVASVNDLPVAAGQSVTTAEDTAVAVTLSGSDADGDPLTYSISAAPQHGTLSGSGGNRTYTPAANYFGSDSFTFQVGDGTATSSPATVTLTITSVNDAPVASSQDVSVTEDTPRSITLGASDPDGDSLAYSILTGPAHGVLSGSGANRTYTPNADYYGTDSFTFRASDGQANSNSATVTLTVLAVNDGPTANGDSYSLEEDTPLVVTAPGVLANDQDADGDPLTAEMVSLPQHGTVTLGSDGSFSYTPAANYHGADSFTYRARDGVTNSSPATVTLTVGSVNDAPVAQNLSVTVSEDSQGSVDLLASDGDGDTLTYLIVSGPAHGTLTGSGASRTYRPAADYAGADQFTYKVSDGMAESAVATVTLTVTPVPDAPVATGQSVTTPEDTPRSLTLTATDADGDALTYTVVASPVHGTLSGNGASRTYTPDANFHGADSFTFRASDGARQSNVATVTITVTSVNDPPVAQGQTVQVTEDTPKPLNLTAADADGDTLTYSIVTPPAHGTLSGSGSSRTYTPGANFSGTDSFTFRVNDGQADSNLATVTLTVDGVADSPEANGDSYALDEDTTLNVPAAGVLANDFNPDGDPLTLSVQAQPGHGTLTLQNNGSFTFIPATNYSGLDTFTYRLQNARGDSSVATVFLTVRPVNDPPVAQNGSMSGDEDTSFTVPLPATDADGDPLTYTVITVPGHGTLSGSGASRSYQPAPDYHGADSLTFKVSDGTVESGVATVSLTVRPVNDAPSATSQSQTTAEDTPLPLTLAGSDPDGDTLSYQIVAGPQHGTLSGSGAGRTYTPSQDYYGSDTFTFRVSDGAAQSNTATVTLTISPANDPPVARAGLDRTVEATGVLTSITLSASASTDPDGDPLTYEWRLAGSVVGNGLSATVSLPLGTHTLELKVSDPTGLASTAEVKVKVQDTTAPQLALPGTQTVAPNAPLGARVSFEVSATDALPGVTVTSTPSSGSLFPLGTTTVHCVARDAAGNESTGEFQVIVALAASPAARVQASGSMPVTGGVAKLKLSVTVKPGKPLQGSFSFTDPVTRKTLKSTVITGLVLEGSRARVFGKAMIKGGAAVDFMAEAEDLGTTRGSDRFRLELSDSRSWGAANLTSGSVVISR